MAKKPEVKAAKAPEKSSNKPTGSSGGTTSPADDPALDAFGEGLKALDKKDWKKAVDLLDKAIAQSDRPELTARAQQYRAAAARQLAGAGAAGAAGTVEADPFVEALFEKNRGNYKAALELTKKGGRDKKDDRFAYLAASVHAVEGRPEEAVQSLSQAIELNPKNRIHAFHDSDFAEIKKNRDYRHLFGLS
jgi:tetratricopeptide (TPR) repeat protein